MFSSRQSSSTDRQPKAGRCPSCGSGRVVEVIDDVEMRIGRKKHHFEAVPHERCRACGERIFGIDASKRFDAAVLKGRRRAA